ncbi:MAG: hypothetical protein H6807_00140 [Planctomycetes bacterium]|nr:hypothetical protein [Planctomycetota bacterium]
MSSRPPALPILCLALLLGLVACGEAPRAAAPPEPRVVTSRYNDLALPPRGREAFRFLVCGHVYGQPGKDRAHPAGSLVAGAPRLRELGADFFMMLGDSVYQWQDDDLARLDRFLRQDLPLPAFNAAGNHELDHREDYRRRFGPTWYAFDHGGCRMVVTDTEIDPWSISGDQLAFLEAELDRALDPRTRPRALFIFAHKPIWAGTRGTAIASLASNTPTTLVVLARRPPDAPTFNRDLRPRLRQVAALIPVWYFAGDVGAFEETTLHLFMARDEKAPALRYLAVGIGDHDRDAVIEVVVPETGEPRARGIELRSGRSLDLEDYGSPPWLDRFFPAGLPDAALPYLEDG